MISPATAQPPVTRRNHDAGEIRTIAPDSRHPLIEPAAALARLEIFSFCDASHARNVAIINS
jgi:hypothetical protein